MQLRSNYVSSARIEKQCFHMNNARQSLILTLMTWVHRYMSMGLSDRTSVWDFAWKEAFLGALNSAFETSLLIELAVSEGLI
jgi:hypothetical protein